jgi:tetratricopeptide (TPR) repeat protein
VASIEQTRLANATDFLDEKSRLAGAMLSLAGSVFDPPTAEISGRLLPEGRRGPGLALTISLLRSDKSYSVVIWEKDFYGDSGAAGPERLYRLLIPAGVWTVHHLLTLVPGVPAPEASQWRDKARLQVDATLGLPDDLSDAGDVYRRLREEGESQLPAEYNLAAIEIRNGQYDQAIERLDKALDRLEDSNLHRRWPQLRLWVLSSLAVAHHYRAAAP